MLPASPWRETRRDEEMQSKATGTTKTMITICMRLMIRISTRFVVVGSIVSAIFKPKGPLVSLFGKEGRLLRLSLTRLSRMPSRYHAVEGLGKFRI